MPLQKQLLIPSSLCHTRFHFLPQQQYHLCVKTPGHKQAGFTGQTSKGGPHWHSSPHEELPNIPSLDGALKDPKNIRCPKHWLCVVARNGFASGGDQCKKGNPACLGQKAATEKWPWPSNSHCCTSCSSPAGLNLPLFFPG